MNLYTLHVLITGLATWNQNKSYQHVDSVWFIDIPWRVMHCQNYTSHNKALCDMPAAQGSPTLTCTFFQYYRIMEGVSASNALLKQPSELNYTLVCRWRTCIEHSLRDLLSMPKMFLKKQTRCLIPAKILTVNAPFRPWVHHLGVFSSGLVMLLIFNTVLPPRFLVRNVQNRVTCPNKPPSHTVSYPCVNVTL